MKKNRKIFSIMWFPLILLIAIGYAFNMLYDEYYDDPGSVDYKPVIYLYPEEEQEVKVSLDYDGEITHRYPKFTENSTWRVTARPDGTLTDENGRSYYALFWEGVRNESYPMNEGFCVRGSETGAFLEDKLKTLGLSDREMNEFIIYWLPQMENSPYNVISFQEANYRDGARLVISPAADTFIRVFMTWYPSESEVGIREQALAAQEREGFTVVEWGGSRMK